jgi:hypothetical protein
MSERCSTQPAVGAWELQSYYRQLKSAIIALEAAWEEGRIDSALADPEIARTAGQDILASYRRLKRYRHPQTTAFRRNSVHALLEPVKELLYPPQTWFPARALTSTAGPDPPEATTTGPDPLEATTTRPDPPEATTTRPDPQETWWHGCPLPLPKIQLVRTEGPDGELTLHINQVIAARAWGLGFEFDDQAAADSVATMLVHLALHRVATDLRDLEDIELWLERRLRRQAAEAGGDTQDCADIHIVPDIPGRRFEQLMLDILNEREPIARRAPLFEDFVEKTDIRVQVPGLNRRRGARIQVTQMTFQERLEEKLSRIRRVNEFIILSPSSLADALDHEEGTELLSPSDLADFWSCFPRPPMTVEELARSLKRLLLSTMGHAAEDPRGPMARVPEPLRRLVGAFVAAEAFRTTSELRARERKTGRERGRQNRRRIRQRSR